MHYGMTGVNLEIDLARGSIEKVEADPRDIEDFLGGKGTSTKILWDRFPPIADGLTPEDRDKFPPVVEAYHPDNVLIFAAPILDGTPVPAANRLIVSTTISPPTYLHAYAAAGGWWGPELKHAGYDKVIVTGKSPVPVYIWINNDKVEIRDASHLWGIGTNETEALIREELDEMDAQVACIGPAGENKVVNSTIEHAGAACSRGVGVAMGDKKLKAIAVRGTKDLNLAHPAELMEVCDWIMGRWDHIRERRGFIPLQFRQGAGPIDPGRSVLRAGNVRERCAAETEEQFQKDSTFIDNILKRELSCYNCPIRCRKLIDVPGFGVNWLKCGGTYHIKNASRLDTQFNYEINHYHIRYGMDTHAIGQVYAFALELREAGILTKAETEGMPEDTREAFFWLCHRIAHREGWLGNVLANGTYWAAREIGRGAEEYAHNCIKGVEQEPIRTARVNPAYLLMYATGDKASITQREAWYPQRTIEFPTKEDREKYIADGWWDLPEHMKEWFFEWEAQKSMTDTSPEGIQRAVEIADYTMHINTATDICGLCRHLTCHESHPVYSMNTMAKLLRYATGMDISQSDLEKATRRTETLVRAYNARLGMRRKDDCVPADFYRDREPEAEARTITEFYKFSGWDDEGIPTKESLEALGMGYVSEDLERRGILSGGKK